MNRFRFGTLNYPALIAIVLAVMGVKAKSWEVLADACGLVFLAWIRTGSIVVDDTGIERLRPGFHRRIAWAQVTAVRYGYGGRVVITGPDGRIAFDDQLQGYGELVRIMRTKRDATEGCGVPFVIRRSWLSYTPLAMAACGATLSLNLASYTQALLIALLLASAVTWFCFLILNQRGQWWVSSIRFETDWIEVLDHAGQTGEMAVPRFAASGTT